MMQAGVLTLISFFTEDGICVASRVRTAATFASRFVGLLNRNHLDVREGLLLSPGGSIHTLGMRIAIDVLFLSDQLRVVKIMSRLRPWRVALAPAQTRSVLELAAGRAIAARLREGTRLIKREAEFEEPQ